jgi:iron complex transport system ATP-binding protein
LARQTNKAILLSTHELDLALQAGDQVWLLHADGTLSQGVPEDLVLNGSFEAAFDKAGFHFDKTTGTFNIHQGQGQKIHLTGAGALAFWTRRALQREGYALSDEGQAEKTIEIRSRQNTVRWISKLDGHYQEHQTIADLLSCLRAQASIAPKLKEPLGDK